jgi:8-oxo-dGTP diphosphatase
MMTVDAVVFETVGRVPRVLLIQRGCDPFKGAWALPGGYLEMEETLEDAVVRELAEETGLGGVALRQFHTFSAVDRDPRGRTLSTAFVGVLNGEAPTLAAASDAAGLGWHSIDALPDLAFDHGEIISRAVQMQFGDNQA